MDPITEITSKFQNDVFNLPIFRRIEYPDPEITICENHPVFINGTKLVNGHPVIDDKHKDSTRIEEFKKIGFSKEYIADLTDHFWVHAGKGTKGSKVISGSKFPAGKKRPAVSYNGITKENQIHDLTDYEIIHKIEIKDNSVYLNDVLIATSPAGKSKAQKEKFCKAIVWSLMNDPISLQDKLSEISEIKPAVVETIPEIVPEIVTSEMITGYPDAEIVDDLLYDQEIKSKIELSTIEADIEEKDNPLNEGFDNHEYDNIECNYGPYPDAIKEMWSTIEKEKQKSKLPVFPAGFIPWLNLTITEEVITA
ncbi:MAG: hypothetical protein M0Q91_12940 [Methanoregula sp.]|jgi:hypothetical protein|nr:hypothetical protein [Methanoregula sp.]